MLVMARIGALNQLATLATVYMSDYPDLLFRVVSLCGNPFFV